jgi:hypothetical protein
MVSVVFVLAAAVVFDGVGGVKCWRSLLILAPAVV